MTLEQIKISALNHDWQGTYYPVPQSLSDSDSDKEIIHKHNVNFKDDFEDAIKNCIKEKNSQREKTAKSYKPLSGISKCLLAFSISLCFLTPVVFIWVLPCPELNNCPLQVLNWDKKIENVEFIGKVNNVMSKSWHSHDLAMLYKQNLLENNMLSGVIAFTAQNGEISWNFTLEGGNQLDCSLIDVTNDEVKDCLIQSDLGIYMVNGATGSLIWKITKNTFFYKKNSFVTDSPVILTDLDNDKINELLLVSNDNNESVLTVISGKTGDLLGQIIMGICQKGHVVHSEKVFIIYLCTQPQGHVAGFYNITSKMIASKLKASEISLLHEKTNFSQNINKFTYEVNGHLLKFRNEGNCPYDCRATISLLTNNNSKNSSKEIAAFMYTNSYLFEPVVFSFKATDSNLYLLKGHVDGFVLKLWEWFDMSSFIRTKKTTCDSSYSKCSSSSADRSDENVTVNFIRERVMMITLNDTNLYVINVSLTEIVQLCISKDDQQCIVCQPDITSQNHSLLIEDLDYDGSKELVSYSTSFINSSSLESEWKLVSNIKIFRLESELPKLYKSKK